MLRPNEIEGQCQAPTDDQRPFRSACHLSASFLLGFLIYGTGIRNRCKLLKTKGGSHV